MNRKGILSKEATRDGLWGSFPHSVLRTSKLFLTSDLRTREDLTSIGIVPCQPRWRRRGCRRPGLGPRHSVSKDSIRPLIMFSGKASNHKGNKDGNQLRKNEAATRYALIVPFGWACKLILTHNTCCTTWNMAFRAISRSRSL